MVVESYIIIGRIIEVNCEQMMNFGLKIRKNKDIAEYSRWDLIRSFEGYRIDRNMQLSVHYSEK